MAQKTCMNHVGKNQKPMSQWYETLLQFRVVRQNINVKCHCTTEKKKMATTVAKGNTRTKPNILFCYTQADHSTVKNILQKTSLWYDLVKWLLHLQHQSNKKQLSEDCYASNWQDNTDRTILGEEHWRALPPARGLWSSSHFDRLEQRENLKHAVQSKHR